MGSLDVDSLFTNSPLEETINICTESIYDQNDIVGGLKKSEFKELFSVATKESYFIFNEFLYKQIDCVATLGSLITVPTLIFFQKIFQPLPTLIRIPRLLGFLLCESNS